MLYSAFIKEFIKKYTKTGWKFTLETSLSVKKESIENIIHCIDYFIVDTKDMDKTRYELYTKGSYDLFLSNLKYLLETVGADKIRVRVPKIPKLNTYADVRLNYELLKNMGFTEIEIFDYIEINKHKRISDVALKNKNDFVDVAKYILSKSYKVDQSELRIYINLSGNKYNIVEYDDATHVLVQKFDDVMELTFQEIHVLKK